MSAAFSRAMDEIDRLWKTSDTFDTKVLQFVGIIAAGALAAAAIVAEKLHIAAPLQTHLVVMIVIGVAGLLGFVTMALFSAIGIQFTAPLDPRQLVDRKELLDSAKDPDFEKAMLPAIAQAFGECLAAQELKWRLFRSSLLVLGVAALSITIAMMLFVLNPATAGGKVMSDEVAEPVEPAPVVTPAPDVVPAKPDLSPYRVTKKYTPPDTTHRIPETR